MSFKEIPVEALRDNMVTLISDEWMLISAGNADGYNMMTASWGYMGEMWGKHCAVCGIRPQRYTREFMDRADYYTLSFFGQDKAVHAVCGKQSGREVDKAAATGLVPVFADRSVYFEQARLVLVCKKLYVQDLDEACFVDSSLLDRWYPEKDYHRMYTGEIVKVLINE